MIPEDSIEEYRRSVTVGVQPEAAAPALPPVQVQLKHIKL
jgi:hypothetical protein